MPVSGRIPADLLELAADIALVGVPSDDVASVILEAHPLPEVFAKLEEAETGGKEESDLCIFLERIFETTPGSELLAHAMPYAEAGLAAGSPRVRKLACAQLGRAIAFATSSEGAAPVPEKLLAVLADVLRDSDAGVAAAAATALSSLASAAPETLNLIVSRLSSFVVDHRPETRLRAHALASKLASSSLRAAAAVAERGLHDELMREVDDRRDPLAVMAAMELLAELVEAESVETSATLGITDPLLPKLATIVSGGIDGKGREHPGFVRVRAAVVGARIAAASATILGELPEAATTTTGIPGSPTFLRCACPRSGRRRCRRARSGIRGGRDVMRVSLGCHRTRRVQNLELRCTTLGDSIGSNWQGRTDSHRSSARCGVPRGRWGIIRSKVHNHRPWRSL